MADKYTYYSLQVVSGATTQNYTMAALKALTTITGYGGTKNKAGTIAGPDQYSGAAVLGLLNDVGGLPEGKGVKVTASDGYATAFTHEQVESGAFPMYDPATGAPITTISGALQMVVAYAKAGLPLGTDVGPLRIAIVSPAADQVTDGGKWAKAVVKIEVQ